MSSRVLLHRFVYPLLNSLRLFPFWGRRQPGLRVVTYHGVLPEETVLPPPIDIGNFVTEQALRAQLRYLKLHYDVLEPQELLESQRCGNALPKNPVLVTCDDGMLNNYSRMLPILEAENIKVLFFITSDAVRGAASMLWYEALQLFAAVADPGHYEVEFGADIREFRTSELNDFQRTTAELIPWMSTKSATERNAALHKLFTKAGLDLSALAASSPYSERFRLMTREQVSELLQAGHSIGGHTASHPVLSQTTEDECRRELADSKRYLETTLNTEVWAIAFPFGGLAEVGEREYLLAEEAGYQVGFINIADRRNPKFGVPRINIGRGTSLAMFAAGVSGFHDYLRDKLMAGPK